MRLLLLNGNTTGFVTEVAATEARRACAPGTEVTAATAAFGAAIIASRTEQAIAEHAIVELASRHAEACDAVLIAVSYDTGLRALRELLPVPVVGMTEAALLTACMLGGGVGMLSLGRRVGPLYRELVGSYGLAGRVAGWRVVEAPQAYGPGDTAALDESLAATACDLAERDGAETVILLGAVMAGAPRRVQARVPVPVLDGIGCGVRQAELLVSLGAPKPLTGSYAAPGRREVSSVGEALAARLRGA